MLSERLVKIGISFWLEADETGILFQDFAGFFYLFHPHLFGFHLIMAQPIETKTVPFLVVPSI